MHASPLIAIVLLAIAAPGGVATGGSLEPQLLSDVQDGALDQFSLLEAVLIAGGCDDQREVATFAALFDGWIASIDADNLPGEPRAKAAELFSRLHHEILRGEYSASCSDAKTSLDTGDFNCLTATVLFMHTAREFQLDAVGLATDGHVLCRVGDAESEMLDVETTCPKWFTLKGRAADRVIDDRRSNDRRRKAFRELTDVELVAKVYYNRGVLAFRQSQFETGLRLTRLSLQLDPHDAIARGNVKAGLNNWALSLCEARKFDAAAERLSQLRALDPDYPPLADNEAHLCRLWQKEVRADSGE